METYVRRTFVQRQAILLALIVLCLMPLAGRLLTLGVVRGAEKRLEAEARLVRQQWTPAPRGRILDRKGRVLAQDRPGFRIAMDYNVLTGAWPHEFARQAAARLAGSRWAGLSRAERDALTAELAPALVLHLDKAWDRLAAAAGATRAELDAARQKVIAQVEARQREVTAARLEREKSYAQARGEAQTVAALAKLEKRAAEPIAETRRAHVLVRRVEDTTGFGCLALSDDEAELAIVPGEEMSLLTGGAPLTIRVPVVPGLRVADAGAREYPLDSTTVALDRSTLPSPMRSDGPSTLTVQGVACHIIGKMRDRPYGPERDASGAVTRPGDAERRAEFLAANPQLARQAAQFGSKDRGAYTDDDTVGDLGVEGSQENTLRGLRGVHTLRLDTQQREVVAPTPGQDVTLTIDAMLQAKMQAALSPSFGLAVVQPWHGQDNPLPVGTALYGAAVVLDIETGEVLACVSTPTYSRDVLKTQPSLVYADKVGQPWANKALAMAYPPGSIVKPLILTGAVQRGAYTLGEQVRCNGYLLEGHPDMLQCMIWKKHRGTHSAKLGHDLAGAEAIAQSCNIFFFTLGRRLGPEGIDALYREFGLGVKWNLGAGPEFLGHLGPLSGAALTTGDAIQMGIGQGPVSWTPLHAADAYATLARGGIRLRPTIIKGLGTGESVDLRLDPAAVREALSGLSQVVNDSHATGHHITFDGIEEPIFNLPGVRVWGKTGTATAPNLYADPDGPAPRELIRTGDHSWFVVLAGRERPRYAVSVMMEYAGSGGKVSGPICNQIIRILVEEGYL